MVLNQDIEHARGLIKINNELENKIKDRQNARDNGDDEKADKIQLEISRLSQHLALGAWQVATAYLDLVGELETISSDKYPPTP